VSTPVEPADDLRAALQKLADTAPVEGVDTERLWRAVTSEVSAEERREVVEKVAQDPSWAVAWRLAHEMWTASREEAAPVRVVRRRSTNPLAWGALAAGLATAVGLGIWNAEGPAAVGDRDATGARIESLLRSEGTLSRADAVLRWTGPSGATWDVRVTSDDLVHVHATSGVAATEYRLPDGFVSQLLPGSRVLWQVEARLPGGGTLRSDTFVNRLD
jgi:hypothetical protein